MSYNTAKAGEARDYQSVTPTSELALNEALSRLPMGMSRSTLAFRPYPFFADRGEGAYLWDLDGNRYLDLVNNYTSLIHGHTHRPTFDAVSRAMASSPSPGAPTALERQLADEINSRIPSIELLRFATTGSEAVLCAIRAARAYTGRPRILKFEGAFHGSLDDVQVSIGQPPMARGSYGPGEPATGGIPGVGTVIAVYNDLDSLAAALDEHGEKIAAVIAEPFLGNAALIDAAEGFLAEAQRLAHAHGALFILDEIQSCRLNYGGAQALHGVTPDITTMGKTIGGGLPLALAGGRAEIMRVYDGFDPIVNQTGTFNAFPLSLAASLATLEHWREPDIARLNAIGANVRESIRTIFARHSIPVSVNGRGSMFHMTFTDQPVDGYRAFMESERSQLPTLHRELLNRGVFLMARGTGCLSTAMTDVDVDLFLEALDDAVAAVAAAKIAA